jgi:NADPH:quinone reductase-like Zn-dependent oxidoreductase
MLSWRRRQSMWETKASNWSLLSDALFSSDPETFTTRFLPRRIQQLIYKNQSLIGFNIPTIRPEHIGECVPALLNLIAQGRVKLFANTTSPLAEVKKAYEALSSRHTIGKVVLTP